jgi:hypothetical protein
VYYDSGHAERGRGSCKDLRWPCYITLRGRQSLLAPLFVPSPDAPLYARDCVVRASPTLNSITSVIDLVPMVWSFVIALLSYAKQLCFLLSGQHILEKIPSRGAPDELIREIGFAFSIG